jgi:hypothetical protein
MSLRPLILLFLIIYVASSACDHVIPDYNNDCLGIIGLNSTICCYRSIYDEKTKTETKSCESAPAEQISINSLSYHNGVKNILDCGNDLPSCGPEFTTEKKHCFEEGNTCCYEQYGSVGKCRRFPSRSFASVLSKVKGKTIKCQPDEVDSWIDKIIGMFKK